MEKNDEFEAKAPDFKGDGVAVWKATDKNGNMFLKVKILNNPSVCVFKNEPKPKPKDL